MDTTLDSIRPSTSTEVREEVSYLFARDPSILAYSQRPCPSKDAQKKLFSLINVAEESCSENGESLDPDSQSLQTVRVYLRLKPFPKKMKPTQQEQEAYQIINPTTLYTKLPVLDNNTSCLKRPNGSDIVCRKFTFTKTFGPETTQLELFEQAVKQQVLDFLAGQNSTIMTYGTTNAGKSYTLQGTTTSPGIIPRGLEFVFSNITPKAIPCYKPINHCDVIKLDPLERAQELEVKTKLLTFSSVDKHQYINTYKEMQKLLQAESPIRPSHHDAQYSVWVSFAEIYNETVYDLLSNGCEKKKTPLKLATDCQGRAFIKGLKTICVNSGSEAYQVLMAGQYNLKVAATALNARSSRSHCIFTIKLLKYFKENVAHEVEVSTFAFCDLAGSERLKKTLNIGDRLKEAQNINTSLLVLGRCLKTIHEGQLAKNVSSKQKAEHIGPFRESKLTRLFQKALSGKEHIALIVNINPLPNLYVETQNVLSFSAIAKKIVIEKEKPRKRRKSRFSQLVTQSIKSVTDWDATEIESEEWHTTEGDDVTSASIQVNEYEELVNENEKLKKEILTLKNSALTRDLQIRKEMADTYTAMMQELEGDWKNRMKDVEQQQQDVLEWSVKQVEDFYKQKIDQLSSRKRRRSCLSDDDDAEDDDVKHIEELESENARLTSKVVALKHSLKQATESKETLTIEKNNITFELGLAKDELKTVKELLTIAQHDVCSDEESGKYLEQLHAKLYAKQDQVKKLKVFLNEAKEEYIAITAEAREKDYQLKEQEEMIVETEEKLEELESHLEHANLCLTEKTKMVETLEEKIEAQTKQLANAEIKIEDLIVEIDLLEREKLTLMDEVQLLKTVKTEIEVQDDTELMEPHADGETESSLAVDERIKMIVGENSALKQRLAQSSSEIQNLKDELELAKNKVQDIAVQICNLQMAGERSKPNDDESNIAKPDVQSVEASCQVEIESEPEPIHCEPPMENKWSQTSCISTTEKVNQTSFVEDSDDTAMLDQFAKLIVKYEDLKNKYKRRCLRTTEIEECIGDDDIIDEFARMIVKYEDLKDKYKDAQSSVSELDEHFDKTAYVTDELKNSIQKHEDLKDEYDFTDLHLEAKITTLEEDKQQIDDKLRQFNEMKVRMEKTIAVYETRVTEMETELRLAQDDHSKATVHLQAKITTLEEDKQQIEDKLRQSNEMKVAMEKTIADYETRVVETELQLRLAQDDHSRATENLEAKITTLEEDKQQIEDKLRQSNEMKVAMEKTIADYETRVVQTELQLRLAQDDHSRATENLEAKITSLEEDKQQIEHKFQQFNEMKVAMEKTITDHETRVMEMEKELRFAQDDHSKATTELQCLKESFDTSMLKCKAEHDEVIFQLKKELSEATERCDIKSQCLDVHAAKIAELEQNLEGITELHKKISELNEELEKCRAEKNRMQKLYEENNDKVLDLEDRLQQAEEKEREKDAEIYQLQKDMKRMIQNTENDDKGDKMMQFEMKNTLKQLTETKEILSRKEEEIENLRVQLKTSEQSERFLDLLQETARERQAENERLKHLNEELKNSILEKEREMESFTKNRDDMVSKYEALVKSQQEELEKQKKEMTKRGTRKEKRKEVDYCENTSEDEVVLKERRKRVGRKALSPANRDDISVIELSGSESKRSVRRTALGPPPLVEPLTDKKKTTRRKKLYLGDEELVHDIEPLESSSVVTPSPQTRSLRSRRK